MPVRRVKGFHEARIAGDVGVGTGDHQRRTVWRHGRPVQGIYRRELLPQPCLRVRIKGLELRGAANEIEDVVGSDFNVLRPNGPIRGVVLPQLGAIERVERGDLKPDRVRAINCPVRSNRDFGGATRKERPGDEGTSDAQISEKSDNYQAEPDHNCHLDPTFVCSMHHR